MIGYVLRFVPVALPALLGGRREPRPVVSRVRRRVALRQVDLNLHMNQAAYAEAFEWGRLDLLLRSGILASWRRQGINPVVAEQRIVYRRELKPLARFVVDSRAVGLDGRLLRIEGHLLVRDRVHAACEVKLIFVGPEGVLPPERMPPLVEPVLTERLPVRDWRVQEAAPAR